MNCFGHTSAERPIVYIHWNTLQDTYGRPKSSLAKAFGLLIEHYQVYIVCPAPTNDPAFIAEAQRWIAAYLSTPSHDHVIFCNQKHLLYGDYNIDTVPDERFMGASLAFGRSDFKTWEEVIVYFERLGGQ